MVYIGHDHQRRGGDQYRYRQGGLDGGQTETRQREAGGNDAVTLNEVPVWIVAKSMKCGANDASRAGGSPKAGSQRGERGY